MPALGDLNIRLILDVITADKNADKISASLKKVETQSNKTKDSMKQTGSQAKEFAGSFGLLEIGVAGALLAFGRFTLASLQMGAELTVLRSTFKGTAEDMELFQTATAGNLTEAELIKLSNYASELGLTTDQQAIFLSLAEDVSDKIGGTVAENFQKLTASTDGLFRGLKSLGISTLQFTEVQNALISATGKTAEELTAAEKSAINYQAIMQLTGYTLDQVKNKTKDVGDKMQSIDTFSKDLQASFGIGVASAFDKVFNAAGSLIESLFGVNDGLKTLKNIAPAVGESIVFSLISPFASLANVIDQLRDGLIDFTNLYTFAASLTLNRDINKNKLSNSGLAERMDGGILGVEKTKAPPKTSSRSASKDTKDFLTYLQEINKEITEINNKIARQTSAESQAEGLFAKKKSLEDEVYLIGQINTGFADYLNIRAKISSTIGGKERSLIAPIPEDAMLKFRILLQDQEKANKDTAKTYEGLVSDLNIADSLVTDIANKLPEGGRSFLSYINAALQAAIQIAQYLKKANSSEGAGFFDFLPIIGSVLGFIGLSPSGVGTGGGSSPISELASRSSFASALNRSIIINMNGELTDHLKYSIVSDGNTMVNVRKNNSNFD